MQSNMWARNLNSKMLIYTGYCGGEKLKKIRSYNGRVGVMISSVVDKQPTKILEGLPLALDNGAFSSYLGGYPFLEYPFNKTLHSCFRHKLDLDFIVTPDIVGGGLPSLEFSLDWRKRLHAKNMAIAVQDGMSPFDIIAHLEKFSVIFVGGSVDWKWKHAKEWIDFAHENGKKCHIGQCGELKHLKTASELGADSCDSVSFVRNDRFDILDTYFEEVNNASN